MVGGLSTQMDGHPALPKASTVEWGAVCKSTDRGLWSPQERNMY